MLSPSFLARASLFTIKFTEFLDDLLDLDINLKAAANTTAPPV